MEAHSGCALVFDLRAPAPAFVLPGCAGPLGGQGLLGGVAGAQAGILGVPAASGDVAFSHAAGACIRACDLRLPASHVYTLSTGNLHFTSLAWHEPMASLLAATTDP